MIRRVRTFMWALNALLCAGILVFAIRYLLFPTPTDRLADIRGIDSSPSKPGREPGGAPESVLAAVRNPVKSSTSSEASLPFKLFALKGAFPAQPPRQGVAFMRAVSRPVDLTART